MAVNARGATKAPGAGLRLIARRLLCCKMPRRDPQKGAEAEGTLISSRAGIGRKEGKREGKTKNGGANKKHGERGKRSASRTAPTAGRRSGRRLPEKALARLGPGNGCRADAFVGEGATVVPAVGPVATVATSGGKVHLWLPFDGRWRAEASSARMAAPSQWRARRSYRRSCGRPRCQRGPRRGEGAGIGRKRSHAPEGGGGGRGGK